MKIIESFSLIKRRKALNETIVSFKKLIFVKSQQNDLITKQ